MVATGCNDVPAPGGGLYWPGPADYRDHALGHDANERHKRASLRAVESSTMSVAPLQFLLLVFAGWVNRRQIKVIEYLQEENRVLREQLGERRLRFTDIQRRRLAANSRAIGRLALEQFAGLVRDPRR